MIELYSVKDVAKLFGQTESRLRYWISSGFIWPSVRRGGQYFYTFDDLITVRTAVELLDSGLSVQKVRKALEELRRELPAEAGPNSRLRICSDGTRIVVVSDDMAYEPETQQLVMAFAVASIQNQIAEVLPLHGQSPSAVPQLIEESGDVTLKQDTACANQATLGSSAYQLFLHATMAEDNGADDTAERYLRQCIELEGSMAAAHTNLGNLLHKQGRCEEAKGEYELALVHDPEQPEARYNLANLLVEMGETEMAIAELRHVCSRNPEFADAHYNLGLLLAEIGGSAQAEKHLSHYLSLDSESEWADEARRFLATQ